MKVSEKIWEGFLELRSSTSSKNEIIGWTYYKSKFQSHDNVTSLFSSESSAILIKPEVVIDYFQPDWETINLPFENLKLIFSKSLSTDIVHSLKMYWALSVMHLINQEKPFVIAHIAASLDGKMATHNGDSKWIGNQENLIHSHRLRALVDGILIGANTVKNDLPSLNVRHVKGQNPTRLVLSNHSKDFSGLQKVKDTRTFLVRDESFDNCPDGNCFDEIIFYKGEDNVQKVSALFKKLYAKGIHSIMIEGGSETISNLFHSQGIDVMQVHYAPIIIGSGKCIVDLPFVDRISDASSLSNPLWTPMGDSFMVTACV